MLLKRTLFCVFGVMLCAYVVQGSKNILFSTYCTILLLLYAPPFWNVSIFTKLIVLRRCALDWPAIQCVVIGWIPQACDGNVTPLTMLWCRVVWYKTHYKRGIVAFSEDIITDCNDSYGLFTHCTTPCKHNTMSEFVIVETPNKQYSTLRKTRVWIVSSKFFKYRHVLTGCESEAPDCPCDVGIAPL